MIKMGKQKFSLESPSYDYRIGGVPIGNKNYNLDLLFSKENRTYPEHISSLEELGYKPASAKIFTSLVTNLFDNRNSDYKEEVEILRKNLRNLIRNSYPFMATGFEYNPKNEKDRIIDNYLLPNQKIENVDLVGPDGFITELKEEKLLETLLGTKEINKTNEVFSWLNDSKKGLYLWRFNSKPETKQIRVAWFGAVSDRAGFSCYGNPSYSDASLGVRVVGSKNF